MYVRKWFLVKLIMHNLHQIIHNSPYSWMQEKPSCLNAAHHYNKSSCKISAWLVKDFLRKDGKNDKNAQKAKDTICID